MPQLNDLIYLFTGHWEEYLPEPVNNALLSLLVALAAFFLPGRALRFFRPVENFWLRFAKRRRLSVLLCGVLALAINAAIACFGHWPLPAVHDEWSYLLAADTFAQGRLTNPAHPMWMHFESFHILQQPTYASKYPPGQGLMLALGQVLFGSPVFGLWMGTAAACMAICWMLQQWLRPHWALLGGVLAAAHPVLIYWTQSYWGCQPAIIGGALAVGGLRQFLVWQQRLQSPPPFGGAWAVAWSTPFLLWTRPAEGGVLLLMVLLTVVFVTMRKHRQSRPVSQVTALSARPWSTLAPIAAVLLFTLFMQFVYNQQVTNNPLKLPYAQHEETYIVSPLFIWQPFKPEPGYNHALMRRFHTKEEPPVYLRYRTPSVLAEVTGEKIMRLVYLHCQSVAMLGSLFFLPFVITRDKQLRLIIIFVLVVVVLLFLESWLLPHYVTPVFPAMMLLGVQALRRMRAWRWHNRKTGLFAARLLVALSLLAVLSNAAAIARPSGEGIIYTYPGLRKFASLRDRTQKALEALPGNHLVLVHYGRAHETGMEWVYNRADIEDAKVVWARSMNPTKDSALLKYFRKQNRRVWHIYPDNPSRTTDASTLP